jgi:uncharacterized protein YukE
MTTIHMETERAREMALQLDRWAESLLASASSLRSAANRLSGAWEGPRAETFNGNFRTWVKGFESQAEQLQNLSLRLGREVDEWQTTDSDSTDGWQSISRTSTFLDGGGSGTGGGEGGGGTDRKFDWWAGSLAVVTGAVDVAKDLKDLKISEYGDLGRGINWLLDAPHGGWVGRMEDSGRLIKANEFLNSKTFKYGAEVVGVAGAVAGGFIEGESWDKALVTGAMDYVAGKAVEKTIEYLIPGAGQVMLVYDGTLLAGRLVAGGMDLLGMHSEAAWLQNALDVVDISTYTEKLNDAVFDYAGDFFSHLF